MRCYAAREAIRSKGSRPPVNGLMFDIGWSEMAVIAVVALIVIGPRDLPKLLFTAGKIAAKARATINEFQQGLAEMAREAELDELRKKIDAARDISPEREIAKAFDPSGEIEKSLDEAVAEMTQVRPSPVVEPVTPAEPGMPAPASGSGIDAAVDPPPTMGPPSQKEALPPAEPPVVSEPVPPAAAPEEPPGPQPDRKLT